MADNNFYRRVTGSVNYYSDSTSGSEPNMREEFENTLDGFFPEIAKAQTGLLRKMRRDSDNELIACSCVDPITREPDKDRFCGICRAEGFLWDEVEVQFYRIMEERVPANALRNQLTPIGLINIPLIVFYIRYDSDITKEDKLVRLILDTDGDAVMPRKRHSIYRIETLWDYRADNAKLEYFKAFTHEEKVKYLNAPTYGDL